MMIQHEMILSRTYDEITTFVSKKINKNKNKLIDTIGEGRI